MARHEADIRAAKGPLNLKELLALLGDAKAGVERDRQEAIACFLSASEGWDQAGQLLDGAFAREAKELKERKAD